MGFFDEYLNADDKDWRVIGGKPYAAFGLMDNQHEDIEMSKDSIDYAYAGGNITGLDKSRHTAQSFVNHMSCESFLAALLTDDSFSDIYGSVANADFAWGPYQATYTKASGGDRHASYS